MENTNKKQEIDEINLGSIAKGLGLATTLAATAPAMGQAVQAPASMTRTVKQDVIQVLMNFQPDQVSSVAEADLSKLGDVGLFLYKKNPIKFKELLTPKILSKLDKLRTRSMGGETIDQEELGELGKLFKQNPENTALYFRSVAASLPSPSGAPSKTAHMESLSESKRMQKLAGILHS